MYIIAIKRKEVDNLSVESFESQRDFNRRTDGFGLIDFTQNDKPCIPTFPLCLSTIFRKIF